VIYRSDLSSKATHGAFQLCRFGLGNEGNKLVVALNVWPKEMAASKEGESQTNLLGQKGKTEV